MSRHGYVEDCDDEALSNLYMGRVANSLRGKRGQAFLRELAAAMDAMPEKVLITEELIDKDGDCCTLGVVCKVRGLDVSKVDYEDPDAVGKFLGIASCMAAEIEYQNDDGEWWIDETPSQRWKRMRKWVASKILPENSQGIRHGAESGQDGN